MVSLRMSPFIPATKRSGILATSNKNGINDEGVPLRTPGQNRSKRITPGVDAQRELLLISVGSPLYSVTSLLHPITLTNRRQARKLIINENIQGPARNATSPFSLAELVGSARFANPIDGSIERCTINPAFQFVQFAPPRLMLNI